jgi:hypothetical protein
MRILLLREEVEPEGEPIGSFLCGVPSLTLGLGALILNSSYWVGQPIGLDIFYQTASIGVETTNPMGQVFVTPREFILPSALMLFMLSVGTILGGLGINEARCRGRQRKATTSVAGMITCAAALFLAWSLFAWAAMQDLHVSIR